MHGRRHPEVVGQRLRCGGAEAPDGHTDVAVEYTVFGDRYAAMGCDRRRSLQTEATATEGWRFEREMPGHPAVRQYRAPDGRRSVLKSAEYTVVGLGKFVRELLRRDLVHPNIDAVGAAGITAKWGLMSASNLAATTLHTFLNDQERYNRRRPRRGRIDGSDFSVVVRGGALTYDHARIMAYQLVRAAEYLQAMMISHDDLHDENVLVSDVVVPGTPADTFHVLRLTDFERAVPAGVLASAGPAPVGTTLGAAETLHRDTLAHTLTRLFEQVQIDDDSEEHDLVTSLVETVRDMPTPSASPLVQHALFCRTALTEAKYIHACDAVLPAGEWYSATTPAHFVESVLPHDRRPPVVMLRGGVPTPQCALQGLLRRSTDSAIAPADEIDADTHALHALGIIGSVVPFLRAYDVNGSAMGYHVMARALWACRRTLPQLRLFLEQAGNEYAQAIVALVAIAECLHARDAPLLLLDNPAVVPKAVLLLAQADFDVHHPTAVELFHARCCAEFPMTPAVVLAGVQALVVAMTDPVQAAVPPRRLSATALSLCLRLEVPRRPRCWRASPGDGDVEGAFVACVRNGARVVRENTGAVFAELEHALGVW
jgi:hypothetical protein